METDDAEPNGDDWLLRAPEPGRVHFRIATGSEVELTDEGRAALEALMQHLQVSDVAGFAISAPCGSLYRCAAYECWPLGKCAITNFPCAMNVKCLIAD